MNLIVKPHVGHGHPVLGQGACLIRADGGGGAQSFHSLQVLYQTVLASHSLGSQCQAHLEESDEAGDKNKEEMGVAEERHQRQRERERKKENKWERVVDDRHKQMDKINEKEREKYN